MRAQEIFDAVARHLLTQGKQSYSYQLNECVYHDASGLKCAVGCLITEDEYTEDMEEKPVEELHRKGMLPERLTGHVDLLMRLQGAHDSACDFDDGSDVAQADAFAREIPDLLRDVAAAFGLSTAVLNGGV